MLNDPEVFKALGAIAITFAAYFGGKKRQRNNGVDVNYAERRNDTVRRDEYDKCRQEWKKEIHDMRHEVKEDNNRIFDKMTDGFNRLTDQITGLK